MARAGNNTKTRMVAYGSPVFCTTPSRSESGALSVCNCQGPLPGTPISRLAFPAVSQFFTPVSVGFAISLVSNRAVSQFLHPKTAGFAIAPAGTADLQVRTLTGCRCGPGGFHSTSSGSSTQSQWGFSRNFHYGERDFRVIPRGVSRRYRVKHSSQPPVSRHFRVFSRTFGDCPRA